MRRVVNLSGFSRLLKWLSPSNFFHRVGSTSIGSLVIVLPAALLLTNITFSRINQFLHQRYLSHLEEFEKLGEEQVLLSLAYALGVQPKPEDLSVPDGSLINERDKIYRLGTDAGLVGWSKDYTGLPIGADRDSAFSVFYDSELGSAGSDRSDGNSTVSEGPSSGSIERTRYVLSIIPIRDLRAGRLQQIDALIYSVIGEQFHPPREGASVTIVEFPYMRYAPSLRPCALKKTEANIAQMFVDRMKNDLKGVGELHVVKDAERKDVMRRFVEDILRRQLGVVEDDKSLGWSLRRESKLAAMTDWPRRINGSDALGGIQYLTVFVAWLTLVTLTARMGSVVLNKRYLEGSLSEDIFGSIARFVGDPDIAATVDKRLGLIENRMSSSSRRSQCPPMEFAFSGYSVFKAEELNYASVPAVVETRMNAFLERTAAELGMVRYYLWLIPSVGFIGTVIGIGLALLDASDILTDDLFAQQAAIQSMATKLGTAFDTTFVALVLAIVAMLVYHFVLQREETLIARSAQAVIDAIIDPDAVSRRETTSYATEETTKGKLVPITKDRSRWMLDVIVAALVTALIWFLLLAS
jgi:biopolymer transport protein ExbB/TolQ